MPNKAIFGVVTLGILVAAGLYGVDMYKRNNGTYLPPSDIPEPPSSVVTAPPVTTVPGAPATSTRATSTTPSIPVGNVKPACRPSGCSGQICSDQDVVSTCEYREVYACYKTAKCERQASGSCGWTDSAELRSCILNAQ